MENKFKIPRDLGREMEEAQFIGLMIFTGETRWPEGKRVFCENFVRTQRERNYRSGYLDALSKVLKIMDSYFSPEEVALAVRVEFYMTMQADFDSDMEETEKLKATFKSREKDEDSP